MQVEHGESEQKQAERAIDNYIETINRSDPDGLAALFTDDGVLMALDAPTVQGTAQLRTFFAQAFEAITIAAKIHFDDVIVSGSYAFVRTHSDVKTTVKQPNITSNDQNRELFVLRKDNGSWKIARYMFNKLPA